MRNAMTVMDINQEIVRFCREYLRQETQATIRPSEFRVLGLICSGVNVPMELATQMNVSRPMIAGIINALVCAGHAVRVPSPDDGRSVWVLPTNQGRAVYRQTADQVKDRIHKVIDRIGQKKFDAFMTQIRQISQILAE